MRKLGYLAAAAVLIAASAQPAVADEDGYRRHRHHQHHRHHHRSHRHYGVNVTYGTPRYAMPPYWREPSVIATPGLPDVVYGPPIFPDPTELEPSYLVDQVPTGTYPLGQFRDPALFHSPYEYPYVRSGYIAYAYESRRIRRPSYRRDHELFNDFR